MIKTDAHTEKDKDDFPHILSISVCSLPADNKVVQKYPQVSNVRVKHLGLLDRLCVFQWYKSTIIRYTLGNLCFLKYFLMEKLSLEVIRK